jgi:uncharacterized protein (DUF934 family)
MHCIMNLPSPLAKAGWHLLESSSWLRVGEDGFVPDFRTDGAILVPLKLWQLRREDLIARKGVVGVLLDPHDDPAGIVSDLSLFAVIAVDLRRLTVDRSISAARLLRERYGYRGELQAVVGDVHHDLLVNLVRYGFDTFSFWDDKDAEGTLAASNGFGIDSQALSEGPLPLILHRVETVTS